MGSEFAFRLCLLFIFAATVSIGGYHRLQAARSGERISRRAEGLPMFVALRGSGLLLFLTALLYLIAPRLIAWGAAPVPLWLRWTGAAVGLFAVLLMQRTLSALGPNLTDTVVTRARHTLVTSGPYARVRHPYYVTFLLLVVAASLLAANWFIGLVGLFVFALLAIRTPVEEQKLIERFGDEYRTYIRQTGRFVPRLRLTGDGRATRG